MTTTNLVAGTEYLHLTGGCLVPVCEVLSVVPDVSHPVSLVTLSRPQLQLCLALCLESEGLLPLPHLGAPVNPHRPARLLSPPQNIILSTILRKYFHFSPESCSAGPELQGPVAEPGEELLAVSPLADGEVAGPERLPPGVGRHRQPADQLAEQVERGQGGGAAPLHLQTLHLPRGVLHCQYLSRHQLELHGSPQLRLPLLSRQFLPQRFDQGCWGVSP